MPVLENSSVDAQSIQTTLPRGVGTLHGAPGSHVLSLPLPPPRLALWFPELHPLLSGHTEWRARPNFPLLQKASCLSGSLRLWWACERLNPVASESLVQV